MPLAAYTDGERLARSLIQTDESTLSRAWCLADLDDAIARCDTLAERADVAVATIRLYTAPPDRLPAAPTRRQRRNGDRPRPARPSVRKPVKGRRRD